MHTRIAPLCPTPLAELSLLLPRTPRGTLLTPCSLPYPMGAASVPLHPTPAPPHSKAFHPSPHSPGAAPEEANPHPLIQVVLQDLRLRRSAALPLLRRDSAPLPMRCTGGMRRRGQEEVGEPPRCHGARRTLGRREARRIPRAGAHGAAGGAGRAWKPPLPAQPRRMTSC